MSAAERLYRIARLIRDTPLTVQQLVQHLAPGLVPTSDVGLALERNVQRDLKLLGLLDTDYSAVEGRPRKHLLRVQQKQLHPVEALALHAATRLVYHPLLATVVTTSGRWHSWRSGCPSGCGQSSSAAWRTWVGDVPVKT